MILPLLLFASSLATLISYELVISNEILRITVIAGLMPDYVLLR